MENQVTAPTLAALRQELADWNRRSPDRAALVEVVKYAIYNVTDFDGNESALEAERCVSEYLAEQEEP